MSKKDKDVAVDALQNTEPTEEHQQTARKLADEQTNGGSGSVVTKYQLCGKYCGGCPHGPYAWLVTNDGWKYLGKVGSGDDKPDSYQDSDPDHDQEKSSQPTMLDLPDWIESPEHVNNAASALENVELQEPDEGEIAVLGERDNKR